MKVAQIVLTKTKHGTWKIAVMSLKATEKVEAYQLIGATLKEIARLMEGEEWEKLSL